MTMAGTLLTKTLPDENARHSIPLLRSPFARSEPYCISNFNRDWNEIQNVPSRHHAVCRTLAENQIGGAFWLPQPDLPSGSYQVAVLPPALAPAQFLWRQVLARHDATSILVVHDGLKMLKPLLAEIHASGARLAKCGDPHPVLNLADAVYANAACDLGILAALHGRPSLHWRDGAFRRLNPEQVSALISEGTSYLNPFTGERADVVQIAEVLGDWRRVFNRSRNISVCTGMSLWKRRRIAQLLPTGETKLPFRRSARSALNHAAARRGAVAGWSTRLPSGLQAGAEAKQIPLFRVEDGFIRSAGLGSGLLPPASIVVDSRGIYFDPSKPSDLEVLLAETVFSEAILQRATRLIALLATRGVSKYGAGGLPPVLCASLGQRIILVPGQVADDLSVQLGAAGAVRSNLALLRAVRQRNPLAHIVYRPHPDVQAGHRKGCIADRIVLQFADALAPEGSMAALIGQVDEVHTMTSLAGFEALLRGRVVETYGQPFYAGWGLTADHAPLQRRTRRLRLEELVAATLILYPHYVDPATGLPCGPEILIARLEQAELWRPSALMRLRQWQGQARRAWRKLSGVMVQRDA